MARITPTFREFPPEAVLYDVPEDPATDCCGSDTDAFTDGAEAAFAVARRASPDEAEELATGTGALATGDGAIAAGAVALADGTEAESLTLDAEAAEPADSSCSSFVPHFKQNSALES